MKSWLEKNDIKMYSTHNEGKPVVAERFIRTIKNQINKNVTSISIYIYIYIYIYIDKLDDMHINTTIKRIEQLK